MPKKITVVDINQGPLPENEEVKEEVVVDEVANVVDEVANVVANVVDEVANVVDEVANVVDEVADVVVDKVVKADKKMITCPNCNKTMLERNFRSKHIKICGKPKVPKAKPIEQLIEEKKIVQEAPISKPKAKPKPKAKTKQHGQGPQLLSQNEVLAKPASIEPRADGSLAAIGRTSSSADFWESRRKHLNLLNEKKAVTVRRIMSKAL